MNNYELTAIVRNNDVDSITQKVHDILSKHKATILNEDNWGIKRLAYQIEREKEGFYLFMHIEAPPEAIEKINGEFKLNNDILRVLTVKSGTKSA